jgi:hypothetical protein
MTSSDFFVVALTRTLAGYGWLLNGITSGGSPALPVLEYCMDDC